MQVNEEPSSAGLIVSPGPRGGRKLLPGVSVLSRLVPERQKEPPFCTHLETKKRKVAYKRKIKNVSTLPRIKS